MPKIEIYTTPLCPYCFSAKRLLNKKAVAFDEIDLWKFPDRRDEMLKRSQGRQTVPQIFINEVGIGGSDDLSALDQDGSLDELLETRS